MEDQAVRPPRRSETILKMGGWSWERRQWSKNGRRRLDFGRGGCRRFEFRGGEERIGGRGRRMELGEGMVTLEFILPG